MPLLHAVDAQDGRQRIQNHIKEILTPEQKAKLQQFSRQGMMGW
jgi:Spy/CpxP family protein refolding chaperone